MKPILKVLTIIVAIPGIVCAQQPTTNKGKIVKPASSTIRLNAVAGNELFEMKHFPQYGSVTNKRNQNTGALGKATLIGQTTYDLQTNSAIARRVINHGNNKISAVWTHSTSYNTQYNDRGTGYNYFDGTNWLNKADEVQRLETRRTGWPALVVDANGNELVACHNVFPSGPTDTAFSLLRNTGNGWTRTTPLAQLLGNKGRDAIWNRAASSGNNVYILHSHNDIDEADFVDSRNGMAVPTYFYRSTDGGLTFPDSVILMPEYDTSNYVRGRGDEYSIDAREGIVALSIAEIGSDIAYWKSVDNGTTFTRYVVDSSEIGPYRNQGTDINGDGVPDTIATTSGDVHVLIDNNGSVHLFWSELHVTAAEGSALGFITGGTYSNGIYHWDEVHKIIQKIGAAPDLDGDSQLSVGSDYFGGRYVNNVGAAFQPSAGIDDRGVIYLVYSAVTEGDSTDDTFGAQGRSFRDLYVTTSANDGEIWTKSVNITNNDGTNLRYEDVFPSVARHVDGHVHLIWQNDFEPGVSVGNSPAHEITFNDMYYMALSVNDATGITVTKLQAGMGIKSYPNPAKDQTVLEVSTDYPMATEITLSDILGQKIMTISKGTLAQGDHSFKVDLAAIPSGIYFCTVELEGRQMTTKLIIAR